MNYKDLLKIAKQVDSKLRADDKLFDSCVAIQHGDQSFMVYQYAGLTEFKDPEGEKWYVIFTEHHGCHVYHEEDLEWCFVVPHAEIMDLSRSLLRKYEGADGFTFKGKNLKSICKKFGVPFPS